MRLFHGKTCPPDSFPLDDILGLAQTGRIIKPNGKAGKIEIDMQNVTGRAGNVRNDSNVALGQMVQQARFAGIRRTGNDHLEAITHDFAGASRAKMVNNLFLQNPHIRPDRRCDGAGYIVLIGKIELRFDHRPRMRQPFRPRIVKSGETAGCVFSGEAALHLGLGCDQVGQSLHLDQIHSSILEGSPGKLARLRAAQSLKFAQRSQHGFYSGTAAMNLQLGAVFTGEGIRTGKKENDTVIQFFTVAIPNRKQGGAARGWNVTAQIRDSVAGFGTAYTDDRDAGGQSAAGKRIDRICNAHGKNIPDANRRGSLRTRIDSGS